MRRLVYTFLLIFAFVCADAQTKCVDTAAVRVAVERMLPDYPQLTLQDIYKSFFQDRFGPGHIVPDSAKAAAYLRHELASVDNLDVMLYEPTGDKGDYYRVKEVQPVEVEHWAAEWQQIEGIIATMGLSMPNYDADAKAIAAMLAEGHYAVHHSRLYNEHYAPHYRIMAKEIFEKEILPLIE